MSECLCRHEPPMHNTAFVQYPACDHVLGVQVDDIIAEEKNPAALMRKGRCGSNLHGSGHSTNVGFYLLKRTKLLRLRSAKRRRSCLTWKIWLPHGPALVNFPWSRGRIWKRSPTRPSAATWKIGASSSLLIVTMTFEALMPARCWMAPEIPTAMERSGAPCRSGRPVSRSEHSWHPQRPARHSSPRRAGLRSARHGS